MNDRVPGDQSCSAPQWWLTEGPEICTFCEAGVQPEMLAYCRLCDRGVCYLCCIGDDPEEAVLCPECVATHNSVSGRDKEQT